MICEIVTPFKRSVVIVTKSPILSLTFVDNELTRMHRQTIAEHKTMVMHKMACTHMEQHTQQVQPIKVSSFILHNNKFCIARL